MHRSVSWRPDDPVGIPRSHRLSGEGGGWRDVRFSVAASELREGDVVLLRALVRVPGDEPSDLPGDDRVRRTILSLESREGTLVAAVDGP